MAMGRSPQVPFRVGKRPSFQPSFDLARPTPAELTKS